MNRLCFTVTVLLLLISAGLQAAIVTEIGSSGHTLIDNSTDGLVGMDVDFQAPSPVELDVEVTAGDLSVSTFSLTFNTAVGNVPGDTWTRFEVAVTGATFRSFGDVTSYAGTVTGTFPTSSTFDVTLTPAETFGLDLGDPLNTGQIEFAFDISDFSAGEHFQFSMVPIAVPEPGAFVFAGLAGMFAVFRARRRS